MTDSPETTSHGTVAQYSADYGAVVLGRIFPHRLDELEYALERLNLEHFRDGMHKTFWAVLTDYWARYREVFPAKYLIDLLASHGVEAARILVLSNAYESYVDAEVSEGEFRAAVDYLRGARAKFQTGQVITTAFQILENGLEVDGELLTGHQAAREWLTSQMALIEEQEVSEESPGGDIRLESERLLKLYESIDGQEEARGVEFGIARIDEETGGVQPGELCLIAAYSSQGKSQVCAQMAWNTAVKQKRGVYFATTETVRDTTIRRILARHSREPKFGLPDGLNSKAIQKGTLTAKEKQVYVNVLEDFAKSAAMVHIDQMPRNATLDMVFHRAELVNRLERVDLVVMDYLQLLTVPRPRGEREDFNQILRQAKVGATTFDKGRAVAFVSPWQIKQAAYTAALEAQSYSLGSLADTSEADKSPDLIVALLLPSPENPHLAKMQTLKHRDGPIILPFDIEVDYATSFLTMPGQAIASYAPVNSITSGATGNSQFGEALKALNL